MPMDCPKYTGPTAQAAPDSRSGRSPMAMRRAMASRWSGLGSAKPAKRVSADSRPRGPSRTVDSPGVFPGGRETPAASIGVRVGPGGAEPSGHRRRVDVVEGSGTSYRANKTNRWSDLSPSGSGRNSSGAAHSRLVARKLRPPATRRTARTAPLTASGQPHGRDLREVIAA